MKAARESAKGMAVLSTVEFLRLEHGDVELVRVLGTLEPEVRRRIGAAQATEELDYGDIVALWESIEHEFGAIEPRWIERSGAYSIESRGAQMYGGILRKSSPTEFLTQSISLFRLFYHPGDMQVVEEGPGRAVLRLVGFDARTSLFCRRQTGGLTKALEIAGGERPVTRHVRCGCEGDAFCEWEMTWAVPRDPERRETPPRGLRLAG